MLAGVLTVLTLVASLAGFARPPNGFIRDMNLDRAHSESIVVSKATACTPQRLSFVFDAEKLKLLEVAVQATAAQH